MNYINLLTRGLLILYCGLLFMFALGEGIAKEGFVHAVAAMLIILLMVALKHKPILSFISFFTLFVLSVWFFKTYNNLVSFSIISLPLAVSSVLFLLARWYASIESHN